MEIDKENLHHAYLILGDKSDTESLIGTLFDKLEIKRVGNPDVVFWTDEKFGIDEARTLKIRAESKAFGEKKIFVISSNQITPEAQNALLKLFEEPTSNTHFFIISKRNSLLPTLLSRVNIVDLHSQVLSYKEAERFIKSNVEDRLSFVKSKLEDDGFSLADFLEELVLALKQNNAKAGDLKNAFHLVKFSNDPAVNARLILEHLALTLPLSLE